MEEIPEEEVIKAEKVYKYNEEYGSQGVVAFEEFEPERMDITDLAKLNKPLIIKDYEKRPGKFLDKDGKPKEFVVVLAILDGNNITFGTSGILMQQILQAKEDNKLPLEATIIKKKSKATGQNYYTLS